MKQISILIPCHNEEKGIDSVLSGIPYDAMTKRGFTWEVIVVDNASTDKTAAVAKHYRQARIIHERRLGKGYALVTGMKAVSPHSDYVVFLDGDDTYKAHEILRLIEPLESGFCDVIVGSRLGGKTIRGSLSFSHRLANWFFAFLVRTIYQANITDTLTGYIALKRSLLPRIIPHLHSRDFAIEMELITKLNRMGYEIYSVPVTYDRRLGKSKLHSMPDAFRILHMFLKNLLWRPIL